MEPTDSVPPDLAALQQTAADPGAGHEARRSALAAMGRLEGEAARAALISFRHLSDPILRSEVVAALGQIDRDKEEIPLLIEAMSDPEALVRDRACDALGGPIHAGLEAALREMVSAPLIGLLADPEVSVRQSSAFALSYLVDERAREPLAAQLSDMRARAGHALALLGDTRALEALLAIVRNSRDAWNIDTALDALSLLGDPKATPALLAAPRKEREDSFPQQDCVRALGQLGDRRAVSPLSRLLRKSEGALRTEIAWALGSLGGRRAARALKRDLRKGDATARESAAAALGRAGRGRRALRRALGDADAEVRSAAIKSLRRMADKPSTGAIAALLSDINAGVRYEAIEAMRILWDGRHNEARGGHAVYQSLVAALCDTEEEVCLAAIDTLVSLAWRCPTREFKELLRSEKPAVARAAAAALARMGR